MGPSVPPGEGQAAWTLFLAREACAPQLRRVAGGDAPPPLVEAAVADAQLILLLRAELSAVLAEAARIGVRPVVLKGGAMLHDPARAVRAKDIDLLVTPADGVALAAALDAAGWEAVGAATLHHLAPRRRPGHPPIEIHTTSGGASVGLGVETESRAVGHPAAPAARWLAPEDRVRQLALHQAVQHAAYRGRLRDLLLLAEALKATTAPEPAQWGLSDADLVPVQRVLAMAGAIGAGAVAEDPFEELAAIWYEMDRAAAGRPATRLRAGLAHWIFDFAGEGGGWRERWRRSWIWRREARSGELLRRFLRLFWLPPFVALGWSAAHLQRSRARRAIRLLDQGPQGGQ